MKILLVNPPIPPACYNPEEYYLPSGLLYLAAALQKNGDEIKILDLKTFKFKGSGKRNKFYDDVLIDTISDFQPALIGLGGLYSGNFPDVLRFSVLIKKRFKKIPIVIGGIHPTMYPFEILKNYPSIDWVIIGEGEQSTAQLVNSIKNDCYEFSKIDGFAFRKNGKVIVNPKTCYIENADSILFPAYELISLKDYYVDTSNWHNPKKLPINTSIPIISSRSCPMRCPFCCMNMVMGLRWRDRSPQNVVDELEHLYSRYNHRHFSFMDDNFNLSKPRVIEICNQIVKRRLDIQFEIPNGVYTNSMDGEVLDAMVSAGLVRIFLGIESGSDFIRNKIMKKNLSKEKIFDIVRLTRKYRQLYVKALFIIGMPEETRESLMDTYNMIKEMNVDMVHLQNLAPFPGTKVFEQALKDKLLVNIDPKNLYKAGDFTITKNKRFFIRPYKLGLKQLQYFRTKCDSLIAKQRANKEKERKAICQ